MLCQSQIDLNCIIYYNHNNGIIICCNLLYFKHLICSFEWNQKRKKTINFSIEGSRLGFIKNGANIITNALEKNKSFKFYNLLLFLIDEAEMVGEMRIL